MNTHFHKVPVTFNEYCGKQYAQHRTRIKLIINPILRFIQFYTDSPYVISSIFEIIGNEYFFVKYSIKKVKYHKL